jgi:hypothetical protein
MKKVRCKGECPRRGECALEPKESHALCICSDERCYCHSQARYKKECGEPNIAENSVMSQAVT